MTNPRKQRLFVVTSKVPAMTDKNKDTKPNNAVRYARESEADEYNNALPVESDECIIRMYLNNYKQTT